MATESLVAVSGGLPLPLEEQRLVCGHGARVNRLPHRASVRINRDDAQIMNETLCWGDELKLAYVLLPESLATEVEPPLAPPGTWCGARHRRRNQERDLSVRCSHIGRDRDCHEFNGSIAELLVWDRALTESEIEDMEDYLCKKWRLPQDHRGDRRQCVEPSSHLSPASPSSCR